MFKEKKNYVCDYIVYGELDGASKLISRLSLCLVNMSPNSASQVNEEDPTNRPYTRLDTYNS